MKYFIEYGTDYTVEYEIEGDPDGPIAFIKSITTETGSVDLAFFDKEEIEDIKFHCREDYHNRIWTNYIETGTL